MKYMYYPGCSLHSSAIEYDMSLKACAKVLGIELEELKGWVCCGATPAHLTDHLLSIALPVKNLLLAKKEGKDLAVACAACFSRLKIANKEMKEDAEHRIKVETIVADSYRGEVAVSHILEILKKEYGFDRLKKKVCVPLKNLKIASYYGCLLVRPPKAMNFDDPEDPTIMDELVEAIGGQPVSWPYKVECCGASFSLTKPSISMKLSHDILKMAKDAGADLLICACPMCQSNLDLWQRQIERKYDEYFNLPILYFTQVLGIALNIGAEELGLKKLIVDPAGVLKEKLL